jgi:hypothetical protein
MHGRKYVKLEATLKSTPHVGDWYFCPCEFSGFRHDVDEIRDLLEYYAAYGGSYLPMFRDNQVDLDFLTLEDGTDRLSRNVGTELSLYNA